MTQQTKSAPIWKHNQTLINSKQLYDILNNSSNQNSKVLVLDTTWLLNPPPTRNSLNEFQEVGRIPSALFFDIDACSSPEYPFPIPHMLPSFEYFSIYEKFLFGKLKSEDPSQLSNTSTQTENLKEDALVVLYDTNGVFSSPRAWWVFKTFGYKNIAILNGGLSKWLEDGYPLEKGIWNHPLNKKTQLVTDMIQKFLSKESKEEKSAIISSSSSPIEFEKRDSFLDSKHADPSSYSPSPVSSLVSYNDMKNLVSEYKTKELNSSNLNNDVNLSQKQEDTNSNENKTILPLILDARPIDRFNGKPGLERAGLPGGHIPFSSHLFSMNVLKKNTLDSEIVEKYGLKTNTYTTIDDSEEQLTALLNKNLNVFYPDFLNKNTLLKEPNSLPIHSKQPFIFTCGSGMTASLLMFAFYIAGVKWEKLSLYDGSWTEWAVCSIKENLEKEHFKTNL